MMKKQKGSLLQRMLAVLLAAVLVVGMTSNAVPMTVLAQGSVSENTSEPVEGETKPAQGEDSGDQKDPETPQPGNGTGEETPEPGMEEEKEQETVSENDVPTETVSENNEADEENGNLQALLARIAALPDAEEYLAEEPDEISGKADEDAYEKWLAGLYAYAEEALSIQEEIEKLTEEQRAQISEKELHKLAAWAKIAQAAGESAQVMAAEEGTSGTCGNGLTWTLADGVLTISGNGKMDDYELSKFGSKSPFSSLVRNGKTITTVVIHEGVTSIGNYAFSACGKLTSIEIPEGVTSIGKNAFESCKGLTKITIPKSVESIGNRAFSACTSLETVTMLSKEPPTIGNDVFGTASVPSSECKFFEQDKQGIHVPKGVAQTYKEAWTDWVKYIVDDVEADTNIASGNGWTLGQNGELTITSNEGMADWIENGRDAYKSNVISVDIQSNVTSIGDAAFTECQNLKNIMISESVESIGNSTFEGCIGLTEITIPKNVASIGNDAFIRCSSLAKVTMDGETPPSLGTDAFSGCLCVADNKQGIHVPAGKAQAYKDAWTDWADYITDDTEATDKGWTFENGKLTIKSDAGMQDWITNGRSTHKSDVVSAEIQNGVTSILANAFDECSSLEKITIPASVTSIGNYAFYWCTSLEEITIPEKVTSIGNYAFYNCPKLKSITIPASVTSIGGHAFQSCKGLENITISANVMSIGESAFSECRLLATVTMLGETPPTLGNDVFGEKGEATRVCGFITKNEKGIHVPAGKLQAYKTAWTEWADYIAEEHEHDGVTFTPWTGTSSLPDTPGNYYLTKDVTLSDPWHLPGGGEMTTLCLNGKTIRTSGTGCVIFIGFANRLNLYDCRDAGKITGGKSSGVLVTANGSFYMYGGKISGNQASGDGGGVSVAGSTFHMYGGEISGNQASGNGGGVAIAAGTFHMYGGEISGNQASNNGGGVSHETVNSLSTVGGSAVISGNTSNGTENNVYLSYGLIELDSSNPLSEPAKIGVTTYSAPTEGNAVNITGHNKGDYSSYFTSDNPAYEIVNANDVVQLVVKSQTHTHNLTLTPAKPATCTEDGNAAYYTCDGCDKWFLDAAGTQEITDKTSVVIARKGHEYDETAWGYRAAEGHAHKCKNCDAHDTVQPHTPGAAATESTPQTCTVCGYIIAPVLGHICDPQPVEKKEPNCTTAGKEAYYHCEGCGKNYEDAAGSRLIADISAWGNIAALGHDWGEWTVTKPATATKLGEKERTCKRCDEKETETIPKTGGSRPGGGDQNDDGQDGNNSNDGGNGSGSSGGDQGSGTGTGGGNNAGNAGGTGAGTSKTPGASGTGKPKVKQEKEGNIRKEVRVEGENMLDAAVETPLLELADMVLTKEEKQKAADGTDIRIVLDVKAASAVVSAADKTIVEAALSGSLAKGYTMGQYLDISLYKVIGSSRNIITETDGKITVRIDVPERLRNTDRTKARTFAVIRVHGGKAELLSDLDNNEDTITIATDRFSTYAVVYKDTADKNSVVRISVEDGSKKSGGARDDEPKTGDNTPLELCATLSMIAGFAYLLLYFADRDRGMTEETKKELVSRLVVWAKQGGRIRRYLALTAIFVLLVYYHSIGKKMCTEWKAIYGE